ncbi:hypothetical protein HPB52_007622 [Rhipicephalus sanguineus]|uniref:Uncharacterized protein n=1 Tax=Rhipicephalus sanguineus TaxID=34632 RepID=A0A9D4Q4W0_RHISA|nr:hypothetical protein HPB52_007622 [Rhipicephalus sanguineus]
MGLRMACVEDGDCQDEANLVCGSDGFDRVCLCDSGYVEEGSGCSESPAQPGEPCDGRMRCAKRTNMVCDQFLKPPRCDCMAGTLWQENKCVALFELTGYQEEERPQNATGSPGARVAIAAIATDRERFVGGVHFRIQDAQADSSSGDEDRLDEAAATRAYSAAEVAAAFGSIRHFCGDIE